MHNIYMENYQHLPVKHIHFNDQFALSKPQKQIIQDVIEWKTPPPLVKSGRSSFLLIDEAKLPFKAIKIKGCGYFDLQTKKISQPSTKEGYDAHIINAPDGIKEIHYQIEVNNNDELDYTIPEKRPYGAQTYIRAKLEYDTNKTLFEASNKDLFPFYYPVGYAEYKDLTYKNEPLGITILGLPTQAEIPLGAYFQGQFEQQGLRINPHLLKLWQQHYAVAGENEPHYFDLMKVLKKLCYEFGKTLAHFHNHFVDFDSHLFNASVNEANNSVVFYDFDHVLDINVISPQKYFYYTLKDFELGLVAILSNFMLSGLLDGIMLFDKEKEPVDDYNLIEAYFDGYFNEKSEEKKKITKEMWERLLLFTTNTIFASPSNKQFHLVHTFCDQEREKSYFDIYGLLKTKFCNTNQELILSHELHTSIINRFLKQKQDLQVKK